MNILDFIIFWFIFIVVVNGMSQGVLRAGLDAIVFFIGFVLAAFVHPILGKFLSMFFPGMWAFQIAFGMLAGGFAIATTRPFDGLLRHDWRITRLRPKLARFDRVAGGIIAFTLSLLFVQILGLLLLTYPVLHIDAFVRESLFVPEIYAHVPGFTGLLPDNFTLAERELAQIAKEGLLPIRPAEAAAGQTPVDQ